MNTLLRDVIGAVAVAVVAAGSGIAAAKVFSDYQSARTQEAVQQIPQEAVQVAQPVRRDVYWRSGRLVYVVDGDTQDFVADLGYGIQIGHDSYSPIRMRLLRVDTPERTGGTPATRQAAAAATAYVVAWFANCAPGEEWPINLRSERRRDSFGRYLAEVECVTGQSLNAELLANGHAVVYP